MVKGFHKPNLYWNGKRWVCHWHVRWNDNGVPTVTTFYGSAANPVNAYWACRTKFERMFQHYAA